MPPQITEDTLNPITPDMPSHLVAPDEPKRLPIIGFTKVSYIGFATGVSASFALLALTVSAGPGGIGFGFMAFFAMLYAFIFTVTSIVQSLRQMRMARKPGYIQNPINIIVFVACILAVFLMLAGLTL